MWKYLLLAEKIRVQVADGTLRPGHPVPSVRELVRATGYSKQTCVHALVAAAVLVPGATSRARYRVPAPAMPAVHPVAEAAAALSARLAGGRRDLGLTQPQLADKMGAGSHASIAQAETSRIRQSRRFWERADAAVVANGELLELHDAYLRAKTCCCQASGPWDVLPPRERQVSALSAQGMDIGAIAREMRISASTAQYHLDRARTAAGDGGTAPPSAEQTGVSCPPLLSPRT